MILPEDYLPYLVVPLFIILFEDSQSITHFLLYIVVCAVLGGWDGFAFGTGLWCVWSLVRFVFYVVQSRGLLNWRSKEAVD